MYEAFDSFLDNQTWASSHPLDERKFFRILDTVVRRPDFSPGAMGDYMRNSFGFTPEGIGLYDKPIRGFVNSAWAIRNFLAASKAL